MATVLQAQPAMGTPDKAVHNVMTAGWHTNMICASVALSCPRATGRAAAVRTKKVFRLRRDAILVDTRRKAAIDDEVGAGAVAALFRQKEGD